ncbi:HAMP domain-containing sensor histidine kinase [Bacteroides helcogenes]|uniref:histidine kinase n=1 Tax=Bacteroides helcogenes (strain ATCC 35417 / DSM 20613 / JCM 6297 / CCUG 15421 / P 36-108) TaxID=693979 RepID=E6SUW1_BACT6|nr:HAMP domain-containing sensor histidine kinase [Bacteroides helcogenes]ADV42397.1 integral membrane sensor signal transduction histidine kinase [Bacteroides helcogenes P 36-108]MDY5237147.1 ATP-binding protein [Bacteroides helcogenes]
MIQIIHKISYLCEKLYLFFEMKTHFLHILRCALCLVFILNCSVVLHAQQKDVAKEFDVDSTLYAYYMRCKASVNDAAVMQMCDTLYRMAGEKRDVRMQAVALSTKLDYHYFRNDKDSIVYYVNVVKKFAVETNQLKYYFFAWGKRLISYEIKQRQYNTALYEADRMMRDAEARNYPGGIANGYNILSSIYETKDLLKLAAENKKKEIEIIQKYKMDTFNLSSAYSFLGRCLAQLGETDAAKKAMEEAGKCIRSDEQEFYLYNRYAIVYLHSGEHAKAYEYIQKEKQILDQHKLQPQRERDYIETLSDYYIRTRQYEKALEIHKLPAEAVENISLNVNYLVKQAEIYHHMGNFKKAADYYQLYISKRDSLYKIQEDITASEYAAMLNVETLNTEKGELQQEIQKRELANKQRIIFFLAILLAFGGIVLYRERMLNSKLRHSQRQLSDKNGELMASEKELRLSQKELLQAKELAEKASNMKTEFIQSMSHEIRTPLNSIVGFSQIISSMSKDNDDTKEFAEIIEQGSNNLLHLVDDVLDIANLDSGTEIETNTGVDATAICRQCVADIAPHLRPCVSLNLHTESEEFYFYSNPMRLSQILLHLLRNAAKFTEKGEIILKWAQDKEHIFFTVTDTGIGIPKDKQEFVFERFTKINTFAQGTGLGLSIGRTCADRMGGSLTLDSSYTGGCRFVLTLPLKRESSY